VLVFADPGLRQIIKAGFGSTAGSPDKATAQLNERERQQARAKQH
jgi:hypothetical protein